MLTEGGGMGDREVRRMESGEVLRRWQRGESRRAIARATGLSRNTVSKYVEIVRAAGLTRDGPPPAEGLLAQLAQSQRPGPPAGRGARQGARLEP
jgi:transcriptional regulator with XRE-family HTH domain